jgi:lipopolysaccharide/colanic/teichoic acid biosynthesis glycosyltransferase
MTTFPAPIAPLTPEVSHGTHPAYPAAKRALDVTVALVALMVLSPVLLAIIVAIRLDSPGPALFRQCRMGKHRKPFRLLKLRGMYADARECFPELYAYNEFGSGDGPLYFHQETDPRVTRVGRWIRRTSIDEIPNLWNVLRGELSLVGPRPEIPELAHLYGDRLDYFLSVKPGLTSPAKADGRDALSFTETLASDLQYIANQSLSVDVRTLGRTLLSVVRRRNTY